MKLILLFAASILLLSPQTSQTGYVYTARMEKFGKISSFRIWADDTRAKFSVIESDDPGAPAGFTIIALNHGDRYILILDEKHSFAELSGTDFKTLMQHRAQAEQVAINDAKRDEIVVNGEGGDVAGIRTRYYKLKITMTVVEGGQKSLMSATEEFWTAPTLSNPSPALDMLTRQTSGVEQLDALLDYERMQGYPLKRVVQLWQDGQFVGSSLVLVTNFARAPIDKSVFEVPANYTRMKIPSSAGQER